MKTTSNLNTVNLSEIEIVSNTRQHFDAEDLKELEQSIIEKGILQPIGILKTENKFRLIYGERRFKACLEIQTKNKKFNSIPCLIFDNLTENDILELQITENLQRKDIHPIEEAEAFSKLLDAKKSIKEIAARVGKSTTFVIQRLKLNNLCDDFKTAFSQNRINISDALEVSILSTETQINYWNDEFSDLDEDDTIRIDDHDIKGYLSDLTNASFDIKDKTLIPSVGACTTCQFNTSCNLLFPEEATKANCTNTVCFTAKSNVSFNTELTNAIENPSVELLFKNYGTPKEEINTLIENGNIVLMRDQFDVIDMPTEPVFSKYQEGLEDGRYDDEDEMNNDYNEDLNIYNEELKTITDFKDAGKIRKGFIVDGRDKGEYVDFVMCEEQKTNKSIKTTSKDLVEKLKSETVSSADFDNEINRLLSKEERNKQLDEEKAQPLFFDVLKNDILFNQVESELIKEEKIAMIFVLLEAVGYYGKKDFNFIDYNFLMSLEVIEIDKLTAKLSRAVLITKLQPHNQDRPSKSDTAKILLDILENYRPTEKAQILANQEADRNKRAERLNEKIEDLENKKAKLLETTKAA